MILTKGKIHPEDMTALNIKALDTGAPNLINQSEFVVISEIYFNIVIAGHIKAIVSLIAWSSTQNLSINIEVK